MKTIKTILHYYRFDIKNTAEKIAYNELREKLQEMGLTCFDSISANHSTFYSDLIAPLDGKEIDLETKFLFNNQWNTAPIGISVNGLRVFDWSEAIYTNRSIKQGMWLEQSAQMYAIRRDTSKCGYCGKNYYLPKIQFCNSCLDSEYLTEDNLPLLILSPIDKERRTYKDVVVPGNLVEQWKEKQKIARTTRNEKLKADKIKDLKRDVELAKLEQEAFQWLIDRDIDFNNVIFYKHTNTFAFGWRNQLSDDEKSKLKSVLIDFPWQWEFSKK